MKKAADQAGEYERGRARNWRDQSAERGCP